MESHHFHRCVVLHTPHCSRVFQTPVTIQLEMVSSLKIRSDPFNWSEKVLPATNMMKMSLCTCETHTCLDDGKSLERCWYGPLEQVVVVCFYAIARITGQHFALETISDGLFLVCFCLHFALETGIQEQRITRLAVQNPMCNCWHCLLIT